MYHISPRYQFDRVVADYATIDEAVYRAGKLSGDPFWYGTILMVWHHEERVPRVRACAQLGKAWFAKPCPQLEKNKTHPEYCMACDGLLLVPAP